VAQEKLTGENLVKSVGSTCSGRGKMIRNQETKGDEGSQGPILLSGRVGERSEGPGRTRMAGM